MEVVKHDLAKDPPSRELLDRLIGDASPAEFLNSRSPSYKERNLGSRKLSKKQVIDLMLEDPNLIRRPIVITGKRAVFGFKPDEIDRLIR